MAVPVSLVLRRTRAALLEGARLAAANGSIAPKTKAIHTRVSCSLSHWLLLTLHINAMQALFGAQCSWRSWHAVL